MDRTQIGLLLRLIGPLIQLACVALLLRSDLATRPFAGIPSRSWLFGGFFLGFALVVVGLFLSRRPRRS